MMQNEENWEAESKWEELDPFGGRDFHAFIRKEAIPALELGMAELERDRERQEGKIRRWEEIAARAAKLADCFSALAECEDFMRMIGDFDKKVGVIFKGTEFPTLGGWLSVGARLTSALRNGASVPEKYAQELAAVKRDIEGATAVRDILAAFAKVCDDDRRLRVAPTRYRTKIFRDISAGTRAILDARLRLGTGELPVFLRGLKGRIDTICDLAAKLQDICRMAKKKIRREGNAFWTRLDAWAVMREAV